MILNQFLANYSDYDRRMSCLKAIQSTSTYDNYEKIVLKTTLKVVKSTTKMKSLTNYRKDYYELKSGLVENLINIIKDG